MNIASVFKKHIKNLKNAYDKREEIAEQRAKEEIAQARTKTQRQKAIFGLKKEKQELRKELYEAKIAANKAKDAAEKARKEAGDLTITEQLWESGERFWKGLQKPRKRVVHKRKTVKRKKSTKRNKTTRTVSRVRR